YADYAAWQQTYLQGELLQHHIDYWRKQLAGTTPLQLPVDRVSQSVQHTRGASFPFALSQSLLNEITALSRNENVTVFMTLLSAFQTLLQRLTGQDDLVVGTDIANRTHVETEALIGFFVNLLALRCNLGGNPSFQSVLQHVRQIVLEAYAHQDLPFDRLVEILQPDRSSQQMPLVRALFVFQNVPMPPQEIAGLTLSPVAFEQHTTNFDLVIFLWEGAQGLLGSANYDPDLFDEATIATLLERFQLLLQQVVRQPDTLLSEIDISTDQEKREKASPQKKKDQHAKQRLKLKGTRRQEIDLT
ncbi:MAG TPA: condensation domain-containing protein, partial [Ktedonobacteraceae bacterium]|nr:condensation domain-containing protein [Ktedonobacteraceae bacterium]